MRKEWFSSKELTSIDGLPSTTQGVNRKARVEKWLSRKRVGVQGKAIEYHIDSFPSFVKTHLKMKENAKNDTVERAEPIKIWLSAYFELTAQEQELVLTWLLRHGLKNLLAFISLSEKNQPS